MLSVLTLCVTLLSSQELTRQIISFDIESGVFDTLDAVAIDFEKSAEYTGQMRGLDVIEEEELPASLSYSIDDLVPSTNFSNPIVASEVFDLNKYPISTAVKLFDVSGDGRRDLCSGVMISDRHVLSSGHCIFQAYTSNPLIKSVEAQIFYDASLNIERTYASKVTKIYFLEGWNISLGDDIAVFELEENIGMMSGWMSIGYNDDDSYFENKHMHKLAYPSYNTPFNDYPFNGDTLYYSHGNIDFITKNFIGVLKHLNGVGGESGSPIFEHVEGEMCVVYGVLTWLGNYSHSRFDKERFYAFSSLLTTRDVSTATSEDFEEISINVYPNPTEHTLRLRLPTDFDLKGMNVKIFDVQGNQLFESELISRNMPVNVADMPVGTLFLHLSRKHQIVATTPFIKY